MKISMGSRRCSRIVTIKARTIGMPTMMSCARTGIIDQQKHLTSSNREAVCRSPA
eukprot:NODE_24132_length_637_cov_2.811765.p6 GENE.NODE_24132_length_637_cov_2.811765~~NODE_24132_length_637_cov_2.811765.p6  ORF type:complete len:55 (-),score=3.17 NODE_24132_length_637_cov_2.811765:217-381(-)